MKTPAPFEAVVVTWEDAQTQGTDQHDSPDAAVAAYRPCIRRTIGLWAGWGRKDARRAAILAVDDDRSPDAPEAIGGTIQIPRGMVISIDPVIPSEPKRRKR